MSPPRNIVEPDWTRLIERDSWSGDGYTNIFGIVIRKLWIMGNEDVGGMEVTGEDRAGAPELRD